MIKPWKEYVLLQCYLNLIRSSGNVPPPFEQMKMDVLQNILLCPDDHLWNLKSQNVIPLRCEENCLSNCGEVPSLIGDHDLFKYLFVLLKDLTVLIKYTEVTLDVKSVVRYQLKMFFEVDEIGKMYSSWGKQFLN